MKATFIGGISHSGTSILRKCLKEHPEVTAMEAEFRLITDPDGLADVLEALTTRWTRHRGDRAVSRLHDLLRMSSGQDNTTRAYGSTNFEEWLTPDYMEHVSQLIRDLTDEEVNTWHRGFEASNGSTTMTTKWNRFVLASYLGEWVTQLYEKRNPNASWFVEDTPENIAHFKVLREMFPGMKFIHIVRHPMDNMHSLMDTNNTYGNDPVWLAERNRRRFKQWQEQKEGVPVREYREIRFEDFVRDHEEMMRTLFGYMGLEWSPELLNNRMDPDRANIGRYDGSFEDEAEIKNILEPIAQTYNYDL